MVTIYDQLSQFFSNHPKKSFSKDDVHREFPHFNKNSVNTTLTIMCRENRLIPVYPRKLKWNVNNHDI